MVLRGTWMTFMVTGIVGALAFATPAYAVNSSTEAETLAKSKPVSAKVARAKKKKPTQAKKASTSTTTSSKASNPLDEVTSTRLAPPRPLSTSRSSIPNDLKKEQAAAKTWTASFSTTRSTSLYDHEDGSRGDSMDYELVASYKMTQKLSLAVKGGYSQDLRDAEASDFADTSLSMSHSPTELGSYVLASPSLSAIVPTSKKSRFQQNLQGGGRIGTSFALNPVVNPNLSLSLTISGGQNFHEYETDINGKVLSKYAFNQSLSAGYYFGDFSISAIFIHKNGWTYQNNITEAFEHMEELGYRINQTFSVAAGHTNSGTALKPNGEDSNLALVDENSSIVYGALTLAF